MMRSLPSQTLEKAISLLRDGGLVALPTETVYGLAANALCDKAVAKIYALKERPQFNPLIVHVLNPEQAQKYVIFNPWAYRLTEAFWPGPLTLILHKRPNSGISLLATAGLSTLAVRSPAHPVAQQILRAIDFPLAAPSANPSESISPTNANAVRETFRHLLVLEGGPCTIGLESTIVDLTGEAPVILRPGSITPEQIENALGNVLGNSDNNDIKAPGQMKRHYAPSIPLRLNATGVQSQEALLSFGEHSISGAKTEFNLSPTGDLQEAAANLFAAMSLLDSTEHKAIAAMAIPTEGIGIAINDRLTRAAS